MPISSDTSIEQHDGADLEAHKVSIHSDPLPAHRVQSHVERPKSLIGEAAFVAILCMAQLMTQVGLGMTVAPLHIIGNSFGTTNQGKLSWSIAAYSLTVGTFILIAGRLGDVYGHKRFFVAGFLWYAIWSLLAGFSVYSNQVFFECCRAFQGIGPAFLLPNSVAILARAYPPGRRQEMVLSLFGATGPSGFIIGATLSSLFAQLSWWPWAFWTVGIIALFLALAGILIIPHTPRPVLDQSVSTLSRTDAAGSVTGVAGLVLFNFAWNQGPVAGWTTPYTYIILIIGCVVLGVFIFIEHRAAFPILPFKVFTSDTGFVLGCMAAGWSSFGIWIFYSWQFLETQRLQSPLLSCAQFTPIALSGFAAALTTGFVLHRVPASVVMVASMTAFTVGLILAATAPVHQSYWAQTFVSNVIMPWGMDMSLPAATIMLSNAMPREHQGLAASLLNTIVNYSISIGLGLAGTVEVHVNEAGSNILKGYHGAEYMGIGLGGLGVLISVLFGVSNWRAGKIPKDISS